jgi:hypothetical protein
MDPVTQREISIECPFCAAAIPPGRRELFRHTVHAHKVGMLAWTVLAVWLLGMFWAILAGPGPPPTLP